MRLSPDILNELINLLAPYMVDERERRSMLTLALGQDAAVLRHIDWRGNVRTFIPHLVDALSNYGEISPGKQALWAMLEYLRSQVGTDVQQRIDRLRPVINPTAPPSKTPPPPETTYPQLQRLLAAGLWREADRETAKIMQALACQEGRGWLDDNDILKLPCEPLHILDRLWGKHSNYRFGFSVQKQIWQETGENLDTFGDRVGWKHGVYGILGWRHYDALTFKLQAPKGHLPNAWLRSSAFNLTALSSRLVDASAIAVLVRRLVACQID